MVVGKTKRDNIMEGIENTGDVRMHDHRLRLKQRFDIVRKLGQGTYGKVQLGINKKTGQEVAIKTIKKCKIESEADLVRIRREVQIMSSVRHPNIVHIYEVFENSEKMILVMEYCSGGELYDYLSQKKVLQEDEARRIFRQVATAVYYCHIHKICHRDLKLENVLLDETGSAKIADFGLSNVFKETSLLSTFCGSPLYASPEIVKGTPYIGPEVDCWSLGVLLYTLVYGAMPFDGSNFKRLVRQISNGDYYEPTPPSSASQLIRDMLTVDPVKRADIVFICDHPWVNVSGTASCLSQAETLAALTPVRLDLLLSLAPPATGAMLMSAQNEVNPDESGTDLTSSASMPVEPSSSAEKRILDLVAEGGADAIKPSPTRTLVSAEKRAKDSVASNGRTASSDSEMQATPAQDEEPTPIQPTLKSSATMTISPAISTSPIAELPEPREPSPKEEVKEKPKPRVVIKKKTSPTKVLEEKALPEKQDSPRSPSSPPPATSPPPAAAAAKPKKFSIPGGNVGSFKEQFERRASLTSTTPEVKRTVTKPVVSKIAKPKAQSEDRELTLKAVDNATVRLQQIGIEPSKLPNDGGMPTGGVKKTESEPTHGNTTADPSVLLQDARRSLQNSMAKLVEEKTGEESRKKAAARDIISSAIRTGKPPMAYSRSSSAGATSLPPPPAAAKVFRTEAQHRVEDHRNRSGVSVERIIPIHVAEQPPATPAPATPAPAPAAPATPPVRAPLQIRRLTSSESNQSEASSSPGEPIKKSAREFIIPIAVEGKGFVTPRQTSLEPDTKPARHRRVSSLVSGGESEEEDESHMHRLRSSRAARAESVSSGEEDEEDEGFHLLTAENLFSTLLHRVRALTNRLNGEEGPGFPQHSLFNNLQTPFFNSPHLSRRHHAFSHKFMESKRSVSETREGWPSRDLHSEFDSMFNKSRPNFPRGSNKKPSKRQTKSQPSADVPDTALDLSDLDLSAIKFSEKEMEALSGLTPALSRRLQKQLLAHLPPAAASSLRRTLSMQNTDPSREKQTYTRSLSAGKQPYTATNNETQTATEPQQIIGKPENTEAIDTKSKDTPEIKLPTEPDESHITKRTNAISSPDSSLHIPTPQFSTLPRLKRHSTLSRESSLSPTLFSGAELGNDSKPSRTKEFDHSRGSSLCSTPDRPLLSKYLTPERSLPYDESFSPDCGSILSEPSYIAAYGAPGSNPSSLGFRRHSMRVPGETPRKRISRFLRPDFFDTPPDESIYAKHKPDESIYAKHKKEKELETQKILREIREKKNRTVDITPPVKESTEDIDRMQLLKDDGGYARKLVSNLNALTGKDRSRSTTPFCPMLDNIKETNLDTKYVDMLPDDINKKESGPSKESKLLRPKSYPVKNYDQIDLIAKEPAVEIDMNKADIENVETVSTKESKLTRPKSYPTTSSSPEKLNVRKSFKKEDSISNQKDTKCSDIEVSFSISLPKKSKPILQKASSVPESDTVQANDTLVIKKYQVVKNEGETNPPNDSDHKIGINENNGTVKQIEPNPKFIENGTSEKKIVKKKFVKKASSKTKDPANQEHADSKTSVEKKKVTKKIKEKSVENTDTNKELKPVTVPKKKSVLQSISQKFEKFTSTKNSSPEKDKKSSSPEKPIENKEQEDPKKHVDINRIQREQSVPVNTDPPTESNLIKRAVTLTDVAALDNPNNVPSKTTVSKVLGLFKKFEPKEKSVKNIEKVDCINNITAKIDTEVSELENDKDKPKRPTSLLLNGLGRKKYSRTSSDSMSVMSMPADSEEIKKEKDFKRNSLKLDFSRLPRVKKIVPTNSVIEPQIMYTGKDIEARDIQENGKVAEELNNINHSRSRSRSSFSNSESKSEPLQSDDTRTYSESNTCHRDRDQVSPEKEDISERIRRKSFYSRFNEKKPRRRSTLVGPGAVEYDPISRIHSQNCDVSPTSPLSYDLSPGFARANELSPVFPKPSDISPTTDSYRSATSDLPTRPLSPRTSIRYDNYGLNDKIDSYRSLDRRDFRKYSGNRGYLEYEPSTYGAHRYARTMSLLDGSDVGADNNSLSVKDPHKYNRTMSLYAPGSYATFRPKRTRNSAIILKESEKEPSPENILEKIRQRKKRSCGAPRTPDELEPADRSSVSPKSKGNSPECSEKVD